MIENALITTRNNTSVLPDETDVQNQQYAQKKHFSEITCSKNMAWADAMTKILKINKSKRRKTIVLSKAQPLTGLKNVLDRKTSQFKIVGDETDMNNRRFLDNLKVINKRDLKGLKKQDWVLNGHVKPSTLEKGREKTLLKIATKGVVQLLNAVREHQLIINEQLKVPGSSENKKEKVLKSLDKRAFLDVLMGSAKSQPLMRETEKETPKDTNISTWSILREDFMMRSKLKDWDKQVDSEIKCIP